SAFALNYFSLGAAVITVFWIIVFFFTLRIPAKSEPTLILLKIMLLGAVNALGYAAVQFINTENLIPRLLLLLFVPFHHIYNVQLAFHYPTLTRPRLARAVFWIQCALSVIIIGYLVYRSNSAPVFFDFGGHFYDFYMPDVYRLYGILNLFIVVSIVAVSVSRLFSAKKGERSPFFWISVGYVLEAIVPAICNLLNKTGYIDRSAYIISLTLSTLTGFCIVFINYINRTTDRTTFMFKVVGASFISFILLFNFTAFFVLKEMDLSFDSLRINETKSFLKSGSSNEGTAFLYELLPDGSVNAVKGQKNSVLYSAEHSMRKTYLYEKLKDTEQRDYDKLKNEPALKHSALQAYLKEFQSRTKAKGTGIEETSAINRRLFFWANKIHEFPEKEFSEKLKVFLEKNGKELPEISSALKEYSEQLKIKDGELKKEVLLFILPSESVHTRNYRFEDETRSRYVSYQTRDASSGKILEAGFYYNHYRLYIHSITMIFFYIFAGGLVLFIAGIPVFLSGALIRPLDELLEGVRKVEEGNLDVTVPVKVQDEIGFLAGSFNGMVGSIRESKEKLQDYAENLEQKVDERTRELMATLKQVELLKEQQDGDYFLTTLLLKPLGTVKAENTRLKVDFFVKQKKEFTFRKQKHQIGGDICISQTLNLKGKKYIVFLNADAMGKSMQGAGGILVLGAVFHSIVHRTKSYIAHSEVPPEKWMKNAFKELHKIFESFDGSMLVSLLFGLVEESTGLVYYINAEHPWMVLYRDRIASFAEHTLSFRKLGHSGLEGEIYVTTFQLHPGDLLIMGSDGKDDVVLSKSKDSRVINENEELFLKKVEEAEGNLERIYGTLADTYEL
ncbi:MAG TPA: SpoIIE family protein phosphatase, partial [Leptospiraceae bacterium]|nr:SpoIIE family protein phosphatase [Leptospiraceae bacterium]